MASLETDASKRHNIRYIDAGTGARQTIYLGAMPVKQARQIMLYVEA